MDQDAPRTNNKNNNNNYAILRDCLAEPLILKSAPLLHNSSAKGGKKKPRGSGRSSADGLSKKRKKKENDTPESARSDDDAEELAEFIDYLASEVFTSFPPDLQTLSHAAIKDSPRLAATYSDPLPAKTASALLASVPVSVTDTLTSYLLLPSSSSSPTTTTSSTTTSTLSAFLTPILHSYISSTTTAPPPPPPSPPPASSQTQTRPTACEICARDWIPLTAHHLIPRSVHAKALKRGWHDADRLNSLARLCRACHSFVHGLCGNEELARRWWSVELLVGREDVRRWGEWAGRVRWKKRCGVGGASWG